MDLGANALEWTASPLEPGTPSDVEACAPTGCYVVRGGSFSDRSVWLHAVLRSRFKLDAIVANVGFRCVKSLP